MYRASLLFLFIITTGFIYAQELITDRPDQTESSSTVPRKSLQWESGFSYEADSRELQSGKESNQSFGLNHSLLRYGITDRIELRLGFDAVHTSTSFEQQDVQDIKKTSLEPLYFGAKLNITSESGIIPELAIITHLSIPVSDGSPGLKDLVPDLVLAGSYTLGESLGFGFNAGFQWPDLIEFKPDLFYSAVLGISHSEKLGTFWEVYGYYFQVPAVADTRADAGITLLLKPNLQLDLSAGIGISDVSPDIFIGLGFSTRFPD
jgi:hypothetical protein